MDNANINGIFDGVEKEYIEYVVRMSDDVEFIGKLISESDGVISPDAVNTALAKYLQTNLTVLAEYQRQKISYESEKIRYDLWEAEQLEVAKKQIISEYEDTKIKPSTKEFDARMKSMNPLEYAKRNAMLGEAYARMRFMLHLRELLASYDRILTTLSSNMRQEMVSLSLDRRMNATDTGVSRNRLRNSFPESPQVRQEVAVACSEPMGGEITSPSVPESSVAKPRRVRVPIPSVPEPEPEPVRVPEPPMPDEDDDVEAVPDDGEDILVKDVDAGRGGDVISAPDEYNGLPFDDDENDAIPF